MDESLARGMKNTFFRKAGEEYARMGSRFEHELGSDRFKSHKLLTRKGLRQELERHKKMISSGLTLGDFTDEGRSMPYWATVMLGCDKNSNYAGWEEFTVQFAIMAVFGLRQHGDRYILKPEVRLPAIRMGEHAAQRLLQRLPNTSPPTYQPLLDELRESILIAHHHLTILAPIVKYGLGQNQEVFVPTPHGAFLGEYSVKNTALELRTWISNEQMRPDQDEKARALRLAVEPGYQLRALPEVLMNRNTSAASDKLYRAILDSYFPDWETSQSFDAIVAEAKQNAQTAGESHIGGAKGDAGKLIRIPSQL